MFSDQGGQLANRQSTEFFTNPLKKSLFTRYAHSQIWFSEIYDGILARLLDLNRLTIKAGNLIFWGIGGLLAWNLYSRYKAAGSLGFFPGKIKKLYWEGLSPVIVFELRVQNTSNHAFNILSFAGNVSTLSNGKSFVIGYVYDFADQQIAPTSDVTIEVKAKLQLTGIVSDLINSFSSGNFNQTVSLDAFANVDGLQVPVDYSYQLAV